jgi:uncharacterized RDD family membrane protein YckC
LRAVLCATFFPVLLLALVNRRNQGLEDVVFGTVVVYDWLPEGTEPLPVAQMGAGSIYHDSPASVWGSQSGFD